MRVASERTSALWGAAGELWAPAGRLPDFSFAGYHAGEDPIPVVPVKASVKDFGAKGDGITDDSDAFLQALASVSEGAIFIPSGRYMITKIIPINTSHVVLRGESRDSTVLFFPKTLHEVLGPGRDGGPYGWSWGGAWIWVNGDPTIGDSRTLTWQEGRVLATVTSSARRGDRHLEVSSTAGIEEGQMIRLVAHETDGLLTLALHDGHQLDGRCMMDRPGQQILNWLVRVEEVKGRRIFLDRPLRTPVSADWKAEIWSSEPVVEEVGIEHLTIEFPVMEYQGHHNEPGQSAISLRAAYNSWVRDVAVVNFDNGIFFWYSKYCTAREIVLAGRGGHYGVNLAGCQDCLLTEFRIDTISVHDLSVANLGNGNVFSWGQGIHINFDHHRYAPFENLFSAIHVGTSWKRHRLWESSGTRTGHNSAARETFWNIQPKIAARHLPRWPAINVIGSIRTKAKPPNADVDPWIEHVAGLRPEDLHLAQLARRLNRPLPPAPEIPPAVPALQSSSRDAG